LIALLNNLENSFSQEYIYVTINLTFGKKRKTKCEWGTAFNRSTQIWNFVIKKISVLADVQHDQPIYGEIHYLYHMEWWTNTLLSLYKIYWIAFRIYWKLWHNLPCVLVMHIFIDSEVYKHTLIKPPYINTCMYKIKNSHYFKHHFHNLLLLQSL
jgi:hypothetical protein